MVPCAVFDCWSKSCWMIRRDPIESQLRTAHPEPWIPVAAAVKCAWNFSKEPQYSSMAACSSPSGWPPPFGDRFVQKMEWLT